MIFMEYQEMHRPITFLEIIRKTPKSQKICTMIFILSTILYPICLFLENTFWAIIMFLVFLVSGIILIILIKKNEKSKSYIISEYRKNNIKPLCRALKKHQLYNMSAINLLIEKCETKLEEKTGLEKYLKNYTGWLCTIIPYCAIIMLILIFREMGIGNDEPFEPTIEWILSHIINYFILDYQVGLLIGIGLLLILLQCSLIHYMLGSLFEEFSNTKRNKIHNLIDDLKFIRMELETRR